MTVLEPVVFYLNGAYRIWRETKRGQVLRLATRKEINRADRLQQVVCGNDCLPPGCGHCHDFPLVEDIQILQQLCEMKPSLDTVFYIHRKAKQIDEKLCGRYHEWRELSERARPKREKEELLMALWADKMLLTHYPDSITGMELAAVTSVEEISKMIEELKAEIVW
jgi:hypothetical protein